MAETTRGPVQAIANVLGQIVVGIYIVVDSVLGPIFRPFMRWLSSLRVVQAVEAAIGSLPAYVVLALLAAPFAVEEVTKVYGLYLMGSGHFGFGLIVYIASHVFAILVCERIFRAGKDKLLTIPWFARLFRWLESYKDRMIAWAKATEAYRRFVVYRDRFKAAAKRILGRSKTALDR